MRASAVETKEQRQHTVLAVHPAHRVRGAIHRSLSSFPDLSICLVPDLAEARAQHKRNSPAVVIMKLTPETVGWAKELCAEGFSSVVLCFGPGADLALCTEARNAGLQYFVELPGDRPDSWARQAPRLYQSLGNAMAQAKARKKVFARSTNVMPPAPADLARSRTNHPEPTLTSRRHNRSTLVRTIDESELKIGS